MFNENIVINLLPHQVSTTKVCTSFNSGASANGTLLHNAVLFGKKDLAKILLDFG